MIQLFYQVHSSGVVSFPSQHPPVLLRHQAQWLGHKKILWMGQILPAWPVSLVPQGMSERNRGPHGEFYLIV